MPFKVLLQKLVASVPGARGAILADGAGEAVEQCGPMDEFDLKVAGAHNGVILDLLRAALRRLDGEDLEEVVVTTRQTLTVVLPITREYFLVLILGRDEVLGQALVAARRCLKQLRKEVP